jgi:tRNA-dihydrouridine synthase
MIRETGCDAVMIGRAAIGNPWLIASAVEALHTYPRHSELQLPTPAERIALALEHLALAVEFKGERAAVNEMKRHLHRYIRGMPDAAAVRGRLFSLGSVSEIRELLLRAAKH